MKKKKFKRGDYRLTYGAKIFISYMLALFVFVSMLICSELTSETPLKLFLGLYGLLSILFVVISLIFFPEIEHEQGLVTRKSIEHSSFTLLTLTIVFCVPVVIYICLTMIAPLIIEKVE